METRYWIGVVGAKHVGNGNKRSICAFGHGKKEAVSKLSVGGRFAFQLRYEAFCDA